MRIDLPASPLVMILSFPALCIALLCYVHGTVEFTPRVIREHRVTYRLVRVHIMEIILILRLAIASFPTKVTRV
jgi:hypothetical protein